jgi:hypothetical protein
MVKERKNEASEKKTEENESKGGGKGEKRERKGETSAMEKRGAGPTQKECRTGKMCEYRREGGCNDWVWTRPKSTEGPVEEVDSVERRRGGGETTSLSELGSGSKGASARNERQGERERRQPRQGKSQLQVSRPPAVNASVLVQV